MINDLKIFTPLLKMDEAADTFEHFDDGVDFFKPPSVEVRIFNQGTVDIDLFLQTHCQCFGITDSGKTNTGAVCAEALLENHVKICLFDSAKQDFVSLASHYPSVKVVNFDIKPGSLASEFYKDNSSLVFDTLGYDKKMVVPYVLDFFRELAKAAKSRKRDAEEDDVASKREGRKQEVFVQPVKIFIDEAQDYFPSDLSSIPSSDLKARTKELIEVIEDGHRQWRAYGITFFLMCQRPTDMITSIRSQTGMYFLHRQLSFIEKEYYLKIIPSRSKTTAQGIRERVHMMAKGECFFVLDRSTRLVHIFKRKTRHGSKAIGIKDVRKWSESV